MAAGPWALSTARRGIVILVAGDRNRREPTRSVTDVRAWLRLVIQSDGRRARRNMSSTPTASLREPAAMFVLPVRQSSAWLCDSSTLDHGSARPLDRRDVAIFVQRFIVYKPQTRT